MTKAEEMVSEEVIVYFIFEKKGGVLWLVQNGSVGYDGV